MSSIAPVTITNSPKPDLIVPAATTPQAPVAGQAFTPLWLINDGTSKNAFEMLGMRMPNAGGDVAALLAQVSLTLENSIDESRKNQTMADFAGLASALATFNLEAMRHTADVKKTTVDDATATLADVQAKTGPLSQARNIENGKINGFHGQISQLEAALAVKDLPEKTRAELSAQLAQAQTGLAVSLSTRQGIDVQLANVRIESLDRQVTDLEAQLASAEPGSTDAADIGAVLTAKRQEASAARTALSTFQAGPKTEATQTAFSNSTIAALQGSTQNLQTRLGGYQTALSAAVAALESGTFLALAAAVRATAAFGASQANQSNDQALSNSSFEQSFDQIAEQLQDVEKRAQAALDRIANSQPADAAQSPRIAPIALGVLAGLADLVSALSQLNASALAAVPPGPTTANRVRLDI